MSQLNSLEAEGEIGIVLFLFLVLGFGIHSVSSIFGTDAEQDSAIKLVQERAEIVAKYDRGREGAQIEPWEDADYLLYKVTDRFGFLQVLTAHVELNCFEDGMPFGKMEHPS
uniref:Uncharacterized protein n=1 Tax=Sphaerodactylus townsendi TaxID=933632 RepID=A0ACB8FM54_9SAUR